MKPHRIGSVALLSIAIALFIPAAASAAFSSTLYPSTEDTIAASASTLRVEGVGGGYYNGYSGECPVKGMTFKLTTHHNASGPVTNNFEPGADLKEYPSKGCTSLTPFALGQWTISAQYGQSTETITIPTKGIYVLIAKCEWSNAKGPVTLTGSWNNGFKTPVSVGTAMTLGGTVELEGSSECPEKQKTQDWNFSTGLLTLTDTTHAESLPLLGP